MVHYILQTYTVWCLLQTTEDATESWEPKRSAPAGCNNARSSTTTADHNSPGSPLSRLFPSPTSRSCQDSTLSRRIPPSIENTASKLTSETNRKIKNEICIDKQSTNTRGCKSSRAILGTSAHKNRQGRTKHGTRNQEHSRELDTYQNTHPVCTSR